MVNPVLQDDHAQDATWSPYAARVPIAPRFGLVIVPSAEPLAKQRERTCGPCWLRTLLATGRSPCALCPMPFLHALLVAARGWGYDVAATAHIYRKEFT